MSTAILEALRELQGLDQQIRQFEALIRDFDPLLAEVEDPALRLEEEVVSARRRLEQMEEDARRAHRSEQEKLMRSQKLEERLGQVTNLREEAAAKAEVDMLRRALEIEVRDRRQLDDQLDRSRTQLAALETQAAEARARVEPEQEKLLADRAEFRTRINALQESRATLLEGVSGPALRVYQSFHAAGRTVVVAGITVDGACGSCFNVVPLQLQNEVRRGSATLVRCEACGVLLAGIIDEAEG
jgi:predicted  nucleic acid-binding Zn-ribbon protein